MPESFKVLVKELQSLCLDVKVLDAQGDEIELKDDEDDEPTYGGPINFAGDELSLYDGPISGNNVEQDEAAEAGYELQDEDDVLSDAADGYADSASDDE